MEKLFQSENGGMITAILAVLAIYVFGECNKTVRAGIDRDYEMSASVKERGEVKIKPSKKDGDEEKDETAEETESE